MEILSISFCYSPAAIICNIVGLIFCTIGAIIAYKTLDTKLTVLQIFLAILNLALLISHFIFPEGKKIDVSFTSPAEAAAILEQLPENVEWHTIDEKLNFEIIIPINEADELILYLQTLVT